MIGVSKIVFLIFSTLSTETMCAKSVFKKQNPFMDTFWPLFGIPRCPMGSQRVSKILKNRPTCLPRPLQDTTLVQNCDTHEPSLYAVFWLLRPPWRAPFGSLLGPKIAQKAFQKHSKKRPKHGPQQKQESAPHALQMVATVV